MCMLINTKPNMEKRDKREDRTYQGAQTNKRWTCAIRYFFVILQREIVACRI